MSLIKKILSLFLRARVEVCNEVKKPPLFDAVPTYLREARR